MRVELADRAGFCFGVRRAMDLVYQSIDGGQKPIYTYGPMIHNEEVIRDLRERGVTVINDIEELCGIHEGTIVIRSHGVSRKEYEQLTASGLQVVDATCPYVKKIQHHARDFSEQGIPVVIVGDPDHPEVRGIRGWCGENGAKVVRSAQDAQLYSPDKSGPFAILVQTTYNTKYFNDVVEIFTKKGYDIEVCNTICNATRERQEAAKNLAQRADAMIVIGGMNSSNSQKLYEICSDTCKNTFFVQTKDDLDPNDFQLFDCVGITAGASTPNYIIEEVQNHVRKKF